MALLVFSVLEELALLLGADALAVEAHEHGLVDVLGEGVDLRRVLIIIVTLTSICHIIH